MGPVLSVSAPDPTCHPLAVRPHRIPTRADGRLRVIRCAARIVLLACEQRRFSTTQVSARATLGGPALCASATVGLVVELTVQVRVSPDRLAVHFDAGGSADRYMGITAYLLYGLGTLLVLGSLWAVFAVNGKLYGRGRSWLSAAGSPSPPSSGIC
ncbi:hypothetical protein SCALM49S_01653 [Streptomyces californicus]